MHGPVVRHFHEPELGGSLHHVRRQRPRREAPRQLLGAERDRVRVAEQRVEPRLHADDGVEIPAVFPLVDEVADARERVPLLLEPCDEAQPADVRFAVPASAPVEVGRWEQAPRPVEPDRGGRDVRPPCEIVEPQPVAQLLPPRPTSVLRRTSRSAARSYVRVNGSVPFMRTSFVPAAARCVEGTLRTRLLINAVVDPDEAAARLPAGLRPHVTEVGTVVGCCLLDVVRLRPAGLPAAAGMGMRAAAHRISVEWDDSSGRTVVGVYVPTRMTDARTAVLAGGRLFPGVHHPARVAVRESQGTLTWSVAARSAERPVLRARPSARPAPRSSGVECSRARRRHLPDRRRRPVAGALRCARGRADGARPAHGPAHGDRRPGLDVPRGVRHRRLGAGVPDGGRDRALVAALQPSK